VSAFLTRRLGWAIITLWLVVSGSFVLGYVLPSDPVRLAVGPHASAEVITRVRAELQLDAPVHVQYVRYMTGVARGDLGYSYRTRQPVLDALGDAIPATALLAMGAALFQWLIGVPIGLFAALRKGRREDMALMVVALVGISAPTFLTGLILMVLFGFHFGMFPLGGQSAGWLGMLHSAVLPSLTLGIAGAAYYSRLTRGEYLDVARRDYIRTARSKGLAEGEVVLRHGLRNALIPVITFFGVDLGMLLGGAVVTESIYAWPGVGKLAIDSILDQDMPVMLGCVLISSAFIVFANLVVDILYAWLDPRIHLR